MRLFVGINDIDAATARRRFVDKKLKKGEVLFHAGEKSQAVAWIRDGELEVKVGDTTVATLYAEQLVGEMALFEDGTRTATVVATKDSQVSIMTREGYEELRDTLHPIGQRLEAATIQNQVTHIRTIGRRVARLGLGEPCNTRPSEGFFAAVRKLLGVGSTRPNTCLDVRRGLMSSALFNEAPPAVIDEMVPHFRAETASAGTFLCTEGENGHSMFVLVQGAVDVIVAPADEPQRLVTLEPGSAFGMVALASDSQRMASCVAAQTSEVLHLDLTGWRFLFEEPYLTGSTFRRAVIRAFSNQLKYSNRQLSVYEKNRSERDLREASRGIHTYDVHTNEAAKDRSL